MRRVRGIDILVNNAVGTAGTGGQIDWMEASVDNWALIHSANTLAAVRMCRRLVLDMRKRAWGRIIHIASLAGIEPSTTLHYGATKAALINFSLGLSKKLARTGITSNVLCPGVIRTPALERWFENLSEQDGWGRDARRGEAYALENSPASPSTDSASRRTLPSLSVFSPVHGQTSSPAHCSGLTVEQGTAPDHATARIGACLTV